MKNLIPLLLVGVLLTGCVGGSSLNGIDEERGPIGTEPKIIELSIGDFAVKETRVGYGNIPGVGTLFEHSYDIDLNVISTGNAETQYELRLYGQQVNVINPPWIRLLTYGPVGISKGAVQSLSLYKATGDIGVGSWKVEVYAIIDGTMQLIDTKETERKR